MPDQITILPRSERARQGNPQITTFCPTCCERTVPHATQGVCMFCDTPLTREAKAAASRLAAARTPRPGKERIVHWLAQNGPATVRDISAGIDQPQGTTIKYVSQLRTAGVLERVRNHRDGRSPLYVVRGVGRR